MHDPCFEGWRRFGVGGGVGRADLAGAAHLELVSGVVQLRPEDAMVEAMLRGWRAQQTARGLREDTIVPRERLVRRFVAFTNEYPWQWLPGARGRVDADADRRAASGAVDDPRLPDRSAAVQRVPDRRPLRLGGGVRGGSSGRRASGADLPRVEHDRAPERLRGQPGGPAVHPRGVAAVPGLRRRAGRPRGAGETQGRAGRLPGRHAVQGDLRRGGCGAPRPSKLDVADWGRNPAAPEFGRYGMLHVRYGKAVRGQPPRRRNVPR